MEIAGVYGLGGAATFVMLSCAEGWASIAGCAGGSPMATEEFCWDY